MRIGVLLGGLAGLGVVLVWWMAGGGFAVVTTPSMGEALPVGTFVLTEQRPYDSVRVGDVVSYRPGPGRGPAVTHRVVAVSAGGDLTVRGDLNDGPDPYPVTRGTYMGTVVWHVRGLGWLLRGVPAVLGAVVLLHLLSTRLVAARWRSSVRVLGVCVAAAVTCLVMRPFAHAVLLLTTSEAGFLHTSVVSTGILPTRVSGSGGSRVDLLPGQVATVTARPVRPDGPGLITAVPHLTGWWWVGAVGFCLLPLVWCLVVGLAPARAVRGTDGSEV